MTLSSGPNLGLLENGALGEPHYAELIRLWRGIDGLVQPTVKSATTTAPPASPVNGDRYLIPGSATGAWAGHTNQIARWSTMLATPAWEYYAPRKGWEVAVEDQVDANGMPAVLMYSASAWGYPAQSLGNISGLKMTFNSTTSISVGTGSANRPADSALMAVAAVITKASLALTANTFYHVYLFSNAGVPDIEIVTALPAAPYNGTARAKTGDTSRRYIGSIRTTTGGSVMNFNHNPATGEVMYLVDVNDANLKILLNGVATAPTDVDCSLACPITSRKAAAFLENGSSTAGNVAFLSNTDAGADPATSILCFLRNARQMLGPIMLTAAQKFTYKMGGSDTSGLTVWLTGYTYER